jgi:hypothetical protein
MIVSFITPYCFVLSWQCDVSVEVLRFQGLSMWPSWQLCIAISFRTRNSKVARPKLNVLHLLKRTLQVPANHICIADILE